jgi:hypothetical protein
MDGRGVNCEVGADCNDSNPAIYEGAREQCNNKDDNCNGEVDEGAGCSTQCVRDRREPDNDSLTGNNLKSSGVIRNMFSCAKCPKFDRDWYKLGHPGGSVTITLKHPTGLNTEGQQYSDLDVEFYCGANFCDSIRGTAGTTTGTFNGNCAPDAQIGSCPSSQNWAIAVYPRCGRPAPVRGTPYSIERR